jgi:RNA polymerase sigma-70 factor (family 1)
MNSLNKGNYTKLADEQLLLQKTANGSREAYTTLYKHYYPGLYRFVSFIIDSHEDSEEIIQDIFLKIWIKRETLIGIRSFENYLFRMAKNRIFDRTRQSKTRLALIRQISAQIQENEDSTYNGLLFQEYHAIAKEAINLLSPRKKQIFLMNAQQEMTAREIADTLGITRTTVKKQLYEAIHFIKDYLRRNAEWLLLIFSFFISSF